MNAKKLNTKSPTASDISSCDHIGDAQMTVLAAAMVSVGMPTKDSDIQREIENIFAKMPDGCSVADVNLAVCERVVAIQKKVC